MKIRNGFVSNSSSSSFLLFIKDNSKSIDELVENSIVTLKSVYDEADIEDILSDNPEYFNEKAKKYAQDNKYLALKERVEYGGEESLALIVPKIIKHFGIDISNIEIGWDE